MITSEDSKIRIFDGTDIIHKYRGKFRCMIIQGRKRWTLDCFMGLHMDILGSGNGVINLVMVVLE